MRITSAGNVGIGTTSPGQPLSISASSNAFISVTNSTAAATNFIGTNASGDLDINGNGSQNILLKTAGIERARIDSNGKLLVGTSTDVNVRVLGHKFQIVGNNFTNASQVVLRHSADANPPGIEFAKTRGTTATSVTTVSGGDNLGQFIFSGADGSGYVQAAQITAQVDGTPGTNDMPGRLVFSTTADGASSPTERMRIDNAGRVLIGQTGAEQFNNFSSDLSLQIARGSNLNANIQLASFRNDTFGGGLILSRSRSATVGTNTILQNNDYIGNLSFVGADGTNWIQAANIECRVDGTPGTNDMPGRLVFSTTADGAASPTERMRLTSAGDLGIGTSAPGYRLDVQGGAARILSQGSGSSLEIGMGTTTNQNAFIDLVGDTTYSDFGFRMIRGSAGANATSELVHRGTGELNVRLQEAAAITFLTTNTERFRIGSVGQLGIGGTNYGSTGQVLVSQGASASPAWGSSIVAGTAVASTSGTSIDFTSVPSWIKRLTVIFNSVSTNGSSSIQLQIGSGSFTTTGYASGATRMNNGGVGSTSVTSGFVVENAVSSGAAGTRNATFTLLNISGNTWVQTGMNVTTGGESHTSGGSIALGGTLDRVRITTINGTDEFDNGSINIMYE
jgi:hypothetical protein